MNHGLNGLSLAVPLIILFIGLGIFIFIVLRANKKSYKLLSQVIETEKEYKLNKDKKNNEESSEIVGKVFKLKTKNDIQEATFLSFLLGVIFFSLFIPIYLIAIISIKSDGFVNLLSLIVSIISLSVTFFGAGGRTVKKKYFIDYAVPIVIVTKYEKQFFTKKTVELTEILRSVESNESNRLLINEIESELAAIFKALEGHYIFETARKNDFDEVKSLKIEFKKNNGKKVRREVKKVFKERKKTYEDNYGKFFG